MGLGVAAVGSARVDWKSDQGLGWNLWVATPGLQWGQHQPQHATVPVKLVRAGLEVGQGLGWMPGPARQKPEMVQEQEHSQAAGEMGKVLVVAAMAGQM